MDVAKRVALVTLFVVCAWFAVKAIVAMRFNPAYPGENIAPYRGYFANVR